MSEDFTARFRVDISDLKKNITEANKEIKLANATFKAETAGMDKWSKDADGLSSKLKQLKKVLEGQKTILEAYKKQLDAQRKAYDENGKRAEELEKKLKDLAEKGVDKNSEEYKKYEKALKDCLKEQTKNEKAVEDLNIKVLEQEAAVGETERSIRHYEGSLEDLGKEEDDVGDKINEAGGGFTVFKGVLADLAATAIKEVINGLKELGEAAIEAYKAFDEGEDNFIKKTGAMGEKAEELRESYKNVASSVVADFGDIGNAVGEVSTRFGVTGEDLDDLSTKFLKFSDLNGTDVVKSIDSVQQAMEMFGLDTEATGNVLDTLNKAAQDSGTEMDTLLSSLTSNADALQEMGFGLNTSVGFLASLEKNGVDASATMAGMKKALQNAAKEGKPLDTALEDMQKQLVNAKDDTEAMQIAMELFGNKAGPSVARAVRDGRLSFDELSNGVTDFTGNLEKTYDATTGAEDTFALLGQTLKASVGDTIAQFLEQNGPEIEAFMNTMAKVIIPAIVGALSALLSIVTLVIQLFAEGWNMIKSAWEAAPGFFRDLWEGIKAIFEGAPAWLSETFGRAWEAIKQKFSGWSAFWSDLWTRVKNKFTGLGTALGNAISSAVKSGVNRVISGAERAINGGIRLINGAIDLINKIPGVSVGKVAEVNFPRLARGGVLKRGQVGFLEGSGAEAVVPLERNKQWIAAVVKEIRRQDKDKPGLIGGGAPGTAPGVGRSSTFTQIINAPKQPSRIELYRQTRNLLELAKGEPA